MLRPCVHELDICDDGWGARGDGSGVSSSDDVGANSNSRCWALRVVSLVLLLLLLLLGIARDGFVQVAVLGRVIDDRDGEGS